MDKISVVLILAIFAANANAQKDNGMYISRAMEIQKNIWQDTSGAFQVIQTPADLNNESAIIIAKYCEIANSATSGFKIRIGEIQKLNYEITFRQRLKINDKTALEKYSSIEYIKILDMGFSFGFSRIRNKMANYIGAKVIKPDGKETIVNPGEEVLTNNEKKSKEAKLAIPGLQVGDILDYYIKSEVFLETPNHKLGPLTFFMNENYPVLYYAIKLKLDIESGVQYTSANGAPAFEESTNDNGDIILQLTQTNLPKYNSSSFTSPFRQYPYISLQCQRATRGYDLYADFSRGMVKQGIHTRKMVNLLTKKINGSFNIQKSNTVAIAQNYFGTKKLSEIRKDTMLKILYNAWCYYRISELLKDNGHEPDEIKYTNSLSLESAVYFSKILTSLDIDNTIYLVCPRNSGSLQHVMNITDFDALLRVKTDKYYWLAFDDIFTQLNEIPIHFQGEEAITLKPEKMEEVINYTTGQGKVPVTIPAYNSISENLDVSFDSANMDALQINRNCRQTGALRHEYQKKLLLTEDIKENFATILAQKNKLEETFKNDRKNQVYAAYASERNNLKISFEDEISHHFNTKPKNLTGYEIIQAGLNSYSIPFEYKGSFILENYVKKAGANFILEVGRLVGEVEEFDEKERGPNLDVYLSCPVTFNWTININIPAGYDVKGIEELNKNVNNETGSFNCAATKNGHIVNIQISYTYAHNFEKASGWPKLLVIMDALSNLSSQKILLEKSK